MEKNMPTLTPPNEPLTLDELREMDGQPAWCEEQKEWGIIHIDPDGMWANIPFFRGVHCNLDVQHQRLTLYSYPPAHIDREAWEPCEECKPCCANCANYGGWDRYGKPKVCEECKEHSNFQADDDFCSYCGRPLTDKAWAELEKRLRG